MNLNDFLDLFVKQFDETDPSEIKAGTEFKALAEWSSMIALSVIAMIDAEYDVQIKGEDIRDSKTIEELFNKVKASKD